MTCASMSVTIERSRAASGVMYAPTIIQCSLIQKEVTLQSVPDEYIRNLRPRASPALHIIPTPPHRWASGAEKTMPGTSCFGFDFHLQAPSDMINKSASALHQCIRSRYLPSESFPSLPTAILNVVSSLPVSGTGSTS